MRRAKLATMLLAAAALLALPAAASADHGHHGKHGGRHGGGGHHHGKAARAAFTRVVTQNAAQTCKAERRAKGDDGFASQWGTNQTQANALGKCVSSRVRLASRAQLLEFASGAISSFGAAGCNTSTAGCALAASGAIEGKPIAHGSFVAALTAVWTSATSNGAGGYCAPTTGTVTLSDGTNTIVESVQGSLCEIGATGATVGHAFAGRYTVTGGTGSYTGAQGSGRLAFYQPSATNAITAVEHGSLGTPTS
jgi:hypothetical protein